MALFVLKKEWSLHLGKKKKKKKKKQKAAATVTLSAVI